VDPTLIPPIHDWELEILQKNGRSFLLVVYNEKQVVGSVLGERIITFKFNKRPELSYRLLRYLKDDESYHCCFCGMDKYEGWHWQQDLEYFVCIGCSQKN
jgi:hypothetical protein